MPVTHLKWWHGETQHRIQQVGGEMVHDTRDPGGGWARRDEWPISEWDDPQVGDDIGRILSDHLEAES